MTLKTHLLLPITTMISSHLAGLFFMFLNIRKKSALTNNSFL